MPVIELTTRIHAPVERCFDLSLCIDLHTESSSDTQEVAVAGVMHGLIGLGETVTWRARHFGVTQHLTTLIAKYERPNYFQDKMVKGAFKRFEHDHIFRQEGEWTVMDDRFDFDAPLGFLGKIASSLVLTNYMRKFLITRNDTIKKVAESEEWRRFLT